MQKSQATSRSERNQPRTNFVDANQSQSQYLEKQLDKLDRLEHNYDESKESYNNLSNPADNLLTDRDLLSKRS